MGSSIRVWMRLSIRLSVPLSMGSSIRLKMRVSMRVLTAFPSSPERVKGNVVRVM